MKFQRDSKHEKLSGAMPRVNSPSRLDEKILAESRRLAPEPKGSKLLSGWAPIAATAFTVAVAFVIARPILMDVDPGISVDEIPSSGQAPMASRVMKSENKLVSPPSVASDQGIRAESTEMDSSLSDGQPAMVSANKIAGKQVNATAFSADAISPRVDEQPVEEQVTKEQVVKEQAVNEKDADEQPLLSDAQFADAIASIERLIDEGRLDEAKRQLYELQQLCPACEFPESVKDLTD